jgi:hypothetical protein
MRLDDLRAQLREIASRAPRSTTDPQAAVLGRGRRLVRRRRIFQGSTAFAAVVAIAGGVALWRSDGGSPRRTIINESPTSVSSTTLVRPTVPPVTVARTSVPETTVPTSPSTTPAVSLRNPVPADDGYSFTSAPVVHGDSVFAIESKPGAIQPDPAPFYAKVVRIEMSTRTIVATSDQPNAAALVVAGDRLWVGVGRGTGGPFGASAVTSAVSLDLQTLAPLGSVTLPAPGAQGLATGGGSVWALSGGKAIRIDPGAGSITATVPLALPTSNPHRTLAVSDDGSHLYVGWATARQVEGVTEYDASTGAKLHENGNVGGGPSNVGPDLSFAGTRLWATFPTGSEASAVALQASDLASTGEVISGPNSMSIAPFGDHVWASRDATLDCVDFHGSTLASHPIASGVNAAAAPTAKDVYASTGSGLEILWGAASCTGS